MTVTGLNLLEIANFQKIAAEPDITFWTQPNYRLVMFIRPPGSQSPLPAPTSRDCWGGIVIANKLDPASKPRMHTSNRENWPHT